MSDKEANNDNSAPSFRSRRRQSHVRRVAQGVTVTLGAGFASVEISPRAGIRSRRISDGWEEAVGAEEAEADDTAGRGGEEVGRERERGGQRCGVLRCVRKVWRWKRAE